MDRFRLFPSGELGMHPTGEWTSYADAQRALDAEREKVKELEAELEEYRSIAEQQGASKAVSQLATLQAQVKQLDRTLADVYQQRDGLQAQLLHMTKERDIQKEVADNQTWHVQKLKDWRDTVTLALQRPGGARFEDVPEHIKALVKEHATLRQLVEALPVVDGQMDVAWGACYYIRSFVAGQYDVVCGLIIEQSTAMAIKTLLEYRATLAAQDAGKAVSSG